VPLLERISSERPWYGKIWFKESGNSIGSRRNVKGKE